MSVSTEATEGSNALKIAFLTASYSRVLPLVSQQHAIALVIHNQTPSENPSLMQRLKRFVHRLLGNPDTIEWLDAQGFKHYSLRDHTQAEIAQLIIEHQIDILVSYFAPILGPEILQAPKQIAINSHPSDLPSYRGGSPLLWQILGSETASAVTIHQLTDKLDCGDILHKEPYQLSRGIRKAALLKQVEQTTATAIGKVLNKFQNGLDLEPQPQPSSSPTAFAPNIRREFICTKIEWANLSGNVLYNLISYLDFLPVEILAQYHAKSLLPLVAVEPLDEPRWTSTGLIKLDGCWYFNSSKGAVRLAPSFNPIMVANYWRSIRAQGRGQLKDQYL